MEALAAALAAMGLGGDGDRRGRRSGSYGGRDAIAEHLRELADARLEAAEAEVGEADWAQVERLVLVRTIDSLWVEHLTELDDMRRGIGLRGYAQQDPLNEFRREAFRLYEELRGLIRHRVATSIFRVTVAAPAAGRAAIAAVGRAARPGRGGAHAAGHDGNGAGVPPAQRVAAGAAATAGAGRAPRVARSCAGRCPPRRRSAASASRSATSP